MLGEPDDNSIALLRAVRWLLIRLPMVILAVNGIGYLNEGRTVRGVVELVITAALIAVDIFVIGRAIRRTKRQINDPEYMKKFRDMSPTEKAKLDGLIAIRWCVAWLIVGTGVFIVMPIVVQVKDLAVCLVGGAFLVSLGVVGLIWGIQAYKHPEDVAKRRIMNKPITERRATLYKDYELGYEPAQEQYCKQTGKSGSELTDADEEMIWEYAYAQIAYLVAWIAENDLYESGDEDSPYLEELIGKIKTREILPTFFISENDGTLYEGNIKESALGFVREYMYNSDYVDGHEVAKPGDIIGAYFPEVEAFAAEHLHAEMFGFPFRWEDYDIFKAHIDRAYAKYQAREHMA